jgi:hypothetical protein
MQLLLFCSFFRVPVILTYDQVNGPSFDGDRTSLAWRHNVVTTKNVAGQTTYSVTGFICSIGRFACHILCSYDIVSPGQRRIRVWIDLNSVRTVRRVLANVTIHALQTAGVDSLWQSEHLQSVKYVKVNLVQLHKTLQPWLCEYSKTQVVLSLLWVEYWTRARLHSIV